MKAWKNMEMAPPSSLNFNVEKSLDNFFSFSSPLNFDMHNIEI